MLWQWAGSGLIQRAARLKLTDLLDKDLNLQADFLVMFFKQGLDGRNVVLLPASIKTAPGAGGEQLPGQCLGKNSVHAADRVADRHGVERVPMVATADGQQPMLARPTLGLPELDRAEAHPVAAPERRPRHVAPTTTSQRSRRSMVMDYRTPAGKHATRSTSTRER